MSKGIKRRAGYTRKRWRNSLRESDKKRGKGRVSGFGKRLG